MAKDQPETDHEDNSPDAQHDRTVRFGRVECYSNKTASIGRRWYWRARSPNGEIVADSAEGYNSAAARDDGLDAARSALLHGQRVDL